MIDILGYILQQWTTGRKTSVTSKGWHSGNAVCCTHRGETQDTRGRAGIIITGNELVYSCFNCNFKTRITVGHSFNSNNRNFLNWIGIDDIQISKLQWESIKQRSVESSLMEHIKHEPLSFSDVELPKSAQLITDSDTKYIDYIESRGLKYTDYPYYITPKGMGRYRNRIIIPYTHQDKLVGYTSRFIDNRKPKYINNQQVGYVFGFDLQHPDWDYAILTEGILDAISINGLALTHNEIGDQQYQLLKTLNRTIICVPDQDKSGMRLIEQALDYGFNVSIPEWDTGIKDINDAVKKYGKVYTLMKILKSSTHNIIRVTMAKKALERKLRI
jgi:hypothetical protein